LAWLGFSEIVVILILVLILFGPKKLPELGKLVGSGMKELRKYSNINLENLVSEDSSSEIPEKLTESPDPAATAALDPGNAPVPVVDTADKSKTANQVKDQENVSVNTPPETPNEDPTINMNTDVVDPDFDEKKYPDNIG
jgi:sec-independent protein translocase protein TatA